RAVDHPNGARSLHAGHFRNRLAQLGEGFDERVHYTSAHGPAAPLGLSGVRAVHGVAAAVLFRQGEHALGAVVAAVKHHVFHRIAQFSGQVVINRQLSGVNDAHVHTVADGVIEEHGVNGFTYRIVTPEGEGDVRHTAGDHRVRQFAFDVF